MECLSLFAAFCNLVGMKSRVYRGETIAAGILSGYLSGEPLDNARGESNLKTSKERKVMVTYYFMIGIPGSGKSTHAASLGCRIICPDTIREKYRVGSPEAFAIARQEIKSALEAGEDVVFDATNTLRIHRADMINAGKPYADKVVCVWMDVPLDVCIARHISRMQQGVRTSLPVAVIERMANQLAENPPDISEGFDEILRINL